MGWEEKMMVDGKHGPAPGEGIGPQLSKLLLFFSYCSLPVPWKKVCEKIKSLFL